MIRPVFIMEMSKGRMWKSSKVIFMGLLVITLLAASGAGCGRGGLTRVPSDGLDPFITERVVEVRIVMKEEDWTACQLNALAEQYVRADFWFDGELVPDVAIRPKGNSSLRQAFQTGSPRMSLKVDFNLFNRARNFRGLKKVNLNNGWSDPTLIRERVAYELFAQMDIPTPRTSFVDLWVNDTHLGVYTMVEQIDKTFLGRHFPQDDGNLYKPEMWAAPLTWTKAQLEGQRAAIGTTSQDDSGASLDVNLGGGKLREIMQALDQDKAGGETVTPRLPNAPPGMPPRLGMPPPGMGPPGMPPLPGVPPGQPRDYLDLMGLKTNETNPDHSALFHFLDILNNEPDETFPAEIEKVLDVDEVLRFLAVSTLIVHLDNYLGIGHNYYLYEIDGKFTILPWDLNMAFGTFNCFGIDRESLINFYIDEPTCGPIANRPLIKRLLSHQPYLDAYHGYLESLLDGPFSVDKMQSRINQLADLIRPFVESDELKFFSTADFERGLTEDVAFVRAREGGPRPGALPIPIGLKTFVVERSESVRQQLQGKRPSAGDGSGNWRALQPRGGRPPWGRLSPRGEPQARRGPLAAEPPVVGWEEAQDHIGEEATVCGPVMSTYHDRRSPGRPTYLHMGKPYPDPDRVVVIIWGRNRTRFPQPPEDYYLGKSICVTGSILQDEGIPWIVLESRTQIKEQ